VVAEEGGAECGVRGAVTSDGRKGRKGGRREQCSAELAEQRGPGRLTAGSGRRAACAAGALRRRERRRARA
jgi:hypothetical protein